MFSSGVVRINKPHANGFGFLSEVEQHALAGAFLEIVLPLVGVFLPVGGHGIDQVGQLLYRSRQSQGSVLGTA